MDDRIERHQLNTRTFRGRHVPLMDLAADHFKGREGLRVLSFGCSSGAECLDLADVFIDSEIVGVDVDERALKQASQISHERISFFESSESNLASQGPFDAIFAMNVLCWFPQADGMEDISEVYPFEKFESAINTLDRHLKPEGLLCLFNCHFFFDDCAVSKNYMPLTCGGEIHGSWFARYRPDGKLATRVMIGSGDLSFTSNDWRVHRAANPEAPCDSKWHEWVDPKTYSGRQTDVSLWVKS